MSTHRDEHIDYRALEWSFGDRLRKLRRAVGVSQGDFAATIGQTRDTLSAWEAGRNTPRQIVAIAQRLELAYGVAAGWVLGIQEDEATGETLFTRRNHDLQSGLQSCKVVYIQREGVTEMITIEYSIGTYYTETIDMHRWFAIEDGERIGELYVDMDREIIMMIEVHEDRRGEGIARALYEAADAMLTNLQHAPAAGCTPEGLAFAEAMGGSIAEDMDEIDEVPELDDWHADELAALAADYDY